MEESSGLAARWSFAAAFFIGVFYGAAACCSAGEAAGSARAASRRVDLPPLRFDARYTGRAAEFNRVASRAGRPLSRAAQPGRLNFASYLAAADGSEQPYSFYLPVGWRAGKAYPCVVHLHGFGGRLAGSISAAQKSWADDHGWILAFPDGRGSLNYDQVGEDDVLRVREELIANQGADAQRIYLTGFSMGGHGTYRLALRYPDKFAAAAPGAGWTDYEEFYPHWYEQGSEPRLPDYLDPTRRSLLLRAAALPWAENGLPVPFRVFYNEDDTINPPRNAEAIIAAWAVLGHPRVEEVPTPGGHGAGWKYEDTYPFFIGAATDPAPSRVVYNTNSLRYDGAFWVRIAAFREREQPARLEARVVGSDGRIEVTTRNIERFVLSPPAALLAADGSAVVTVDGAEVFRGAVAGSLYFLLERDADGFPTGWTARAGGAAPWAGEFRKRRGCEGPVADVTRERFVVIYGASGTAAQTARNRRDALLFCAAWNGMSVLRWGAESVPPARAADWFVPPYPFTPGDRTNPALSLQPLDDVTAAALPLADKNLVLFGDPSSNSFAAALQDASPVKPAPDGSGVTVGGRTYSGATVGWTFVTPRPDAPGRAAVVCKGYLGSLPGLISWGAHNASKDMEQWPWQFPDYVIFDTTDRPPGGIGTEDSEYRYLPESWLEAGFFTAKWTLDEAPPAVRGQVSGPADPDDPDAFAGPATLTLEAADGAGESGTAAVEYRLVNLEADGAPVGEAGTWQDYTGPVLIVGPGRVRVEYRARDRGFSYLYGPDPATGRIRAVQTLSNTGATGTATVNINGTRPPADGFLAEQLVSRLAGAHGAGGRGDTLRLRLRFGETLAARLQRAVEHGTPLRLRVGGALLGPWVFNSRNRLRGPAFYEAGEPRGRAFARFWTSRRTGACRAVFRLRGLDLKTALELPADSTGDGTRTTMIVVPLEIFINDTGYGVTSTPAKYRRREERLPGRLAWRLRLRR